MVLLDLDLLTVDDLAATGIHYDLSYEELVRLLILDDDLVFAWWDESSIDKDVFNALLLTLVQLTDIQGLTCA